MRGEPVKLSKGVTLAEILVVVALLVVGISAVLAMFVTGLTMVRRAEQRYAAMRDATAVFETISDMSLSHLKSEKNNSAYWQALLRHNLMNESVELTNVNAADTGWDDDPLSLRVDVTWDMEDVEQIVTLTTSFDY